MFNLMPYSTEFFNPFRPLADAERDENNALDPFDRNFYMYNPMMASNYPCRFHERDSHYLISMDIPGVSKQNIDIELKDNMIKVVAERSSESSSDSSMSKSSAVYTRSFYLPADVKEKEVKALYENGVLKIAVPKMKAKDGKKIELSSEKESGFFDKLFSEHGEKIQVEKG